MEDGIETNNIIQGNLILGARQTYNVKLFMF